jgi:hypothetical protein
MICGLFQFDDLAAEQLMMLLPDVITVDTWAAPEAEWMQRTLRMITAEAREMSPGGETMITRPRRYSRDSRDPVLDQKLEFSPKCLAQGTARRASWPGRRFTVTRTAGGRSNRLQH